MQQHCSKYFARRAAPIHRIPDPGVERLNSTFSDYSHVTYQIKGNHKCSNKVTNILPVDPP